MNSIQRELLQLLRSGGLEETGVPSNLLSAGHNRFSFSGLVCELYRRHHPGEAYWARLGRSQALRFEGREYHTEMPQRVARWAGLRNPRGSIPPEAEPLMKMKTRRGEWEVRSLTAAHECGRDFAGMADIIGERSRDIFREDG